MEDRAGAPAMMLVASGVLGLVYSLLFLIWTLMPFGTGALVIVADISEKGFRGETLKLALLFLGIPTLQLLGFVLACALGVLTIWGGMKYNRFESKGLVFLALASSTALPVLGLLANSASSLNCGTLGAGFFGCLVGNIGTLPIFLVGLIATIWGVVDITGPRGDRFERE